MMKFITPGQIKAIKTLVGKLALTEAEEDAMLSSYGVDSCTKLVRSDASSLINELIKKFESHLKHRTPSRNNAGHARDQQRYVTDLQIERTNMLVELNGWSAEGLTKFINRQTGKLKAIQMLTKWEASKLIIGLTRVYAGENHYIYNIINNMSNTQLRAFVNKNKKEAQ